MTLSSMTGFARAAGARGEASWVWELKSVNAKGLDLRLRLPAGLDGVEAEARRMLGAVIARGTVFAALDLTRPSRAAEPRINEALIARLSVALSEAAAKAGLPAPGLEALMGIKGVVEIAEEAESDSEREALTAALLSSLEDAVVALVASRQGEGAALCDILSERIGSIAELTAEAERAPARTPEAVRERLKRQITELIGAHEGFDPQRLHQEAVLIAVKGDVREEIDRLVAHVAQVRELLARGGAVGRRLDFLAQELGRESNTLCAKAQDSGLTAIGLALKTLVEQFREQVQNVE
ncbi:MAG: YicC/YloC family endoribonuclease [Beijerinckiaceae bacterium]